MTASGSGPLSAKVRQYLDGVARIAARAKQPGFSPQAWNELAALVDVEGFERITSVTDRRSWPQHIAMLGQWAAMAEFESDIIDLCETGNLVFAELEERNTMNGQTSAIHSLAIYEFNDAGKLKSLTTYQQVDPA